MAILNEYVEIVEVGNEKPTKVYLPNVQDICVIDNSELDGEEPTREYCKLEMKNGSCIIFDATLSFALNLQKNIYRFKMAQLLDVRTNKIFVY